MLEKIQVVEPITLEELRKLTGLSVADFSKEIGIPETTYRRYEREPKKMEVGKLIEISDKFGVPIEKIKV
ncbi:MAG: helix-turn-helix transcriptional regulator [Parabacteroides sp.]|nr:helix-turn-helix transcriptional regulator [Parabacteroides sp.]